ncbi:MAG TPA: cyclase family protein [Acidimicrobiales bacterium]|nr:cyclase family protein [Acidimicrobiales bacterium]
MPRDPMATADVQALHAGLSNWGRWGPDDQLGALNLIAPEVTAAAAATVRTGRTVSCARPLNTEAAADNPAPVAHHMIGTATEGWGADYFAVAPHGFATSHIDALCHIFYEGKLFNGYDTGTVTAHGATRLGIHHLQDGIVTRGVLLDIPAVRGVDALEPGEAIFPEDLEAAEERAGVRVRPGDALLVRTGRWVWRATHGPWNIAAQAAGLDAACLPWLRERDVATLGSDAVSDVMPSRVEGVGMPIHEIAIVALGLHLMDNLDLDALAAACADEGRWGFLFVVAPLVLRRGTASPVNPIAVF